MISIAHSHTYMPSRYISEIDRFFSIFIYQTFAVVDIHMFGFVLGWCVRRFLGSAMWFSAYSIFVHATCIGRFVCIFTICFKMLLSSGGNSETLLFFLFFRLKLKQIFISLHKSSMEKIQTFTLYFFFAFIFICRWC